MWREEPGEILSLQGRDQQQTQPTYGMGPELNPGAHFMKFPETFWARKAIAKSQTLLLQGCFIPYS